MGTETPNTIIPKLLLEKGKIKFCLRNNNGNWVDEPENLKYLV